jgi:hypothetical protein
VSKLTYAVGDYKSKWSRGHDCKNKPKKMKNMKAILFAIVSFFLIAGSMPAAPEVRPELTTKLGDTFKKVTFGKPTKFDVPVFHSEGVARVMLKDLPEALQKQFKYDETTAKQGMEEHKAELKQITKEARAEELAEAKARNVGAPKVEPLTDDELKERKEALGNHKTLKEIAAAKWPDNYAMQAHELKRQREALATIIAVGKKPGMRQLVLNAMKKWPDDYAMTAYEIKRQVEGLVELSK